jgi:Arc/MetJ-type ribon-helix-helix transcriptional regulator
VEVQVLSTAPSSQSKDVSNRQWLLCDLARDPLPRGIMWVWVTPMTIHLKPESERLAREELQIGNFGSIDELIVQSVRAWREKYGSRQLTTRQRRQAVARMRDFAEKNRTSLGDIKIRELLHEGHRM